VVLQCSIVCSLAASGADQDRPLELVAVENARAAMRTGWVTWSAVSRERRTSRTVEGTWYSKEGTRYFESRFTPDELMVVDHGDPKGVTWRSESGEVMPDVGYVPVRYLAAAGNRWTMRNRSLSAEMRPGTSDLLDVRALGVSPITPVGLTVHRVLFGTVEKRYSVHRLKQGMVEVTATEAANPTWKNRWRIDAKRGWNPVLAQNVVDGKVRFEARSTLQKIEDTWFPKRVEFFKQDYKHGKAPYLTITVLAANFDEPDQPAVLTPKSIGVEVGTNVRILGGDRPRLQGTMTWDGVKLVTFDNLYKRIQAGELENGPTIREEIDRHYAMGNGFLEAPTEWERYTEHFISRYHLDSQQTQKAHSILLECQERAHAYIDRERDRIDAIQLSVRELFDTRKPGTANREVELPELRDQMLSLMVPIWEIYHESLVPRLNRLPTRAQRRKAAKEPSPAGANP